MNSILLYAKWVNIRARIGKCLQISVLFAFSFFLQLPLLAQENELSLKQILLMPGDLTEPHADIETQCESCHVHFKKANQTPLCLDCHKVIRKEITQKLGFHGRLSTTQHSDCASCHTDHKGRDFDITALDKEHFDHSQTDFNLKGKHRSLSCNNCHWQTDAEKAPLPKGIRDLPVDKAYRFKSMQCNSCHEDYHEKKLGDKCESCHSESGWQESEFDHSKTEFPLTNSHLEIACKSCHIGSKFQKVDSKCQSCHLPKDPHLGIFGTQCQDCHNTEEWLKSDFDHMLDAHFQLKGKHQSLSCIDCHASQLKPATDCNGCHKDDDPHLGGNGIQCQDCHNQTRWKETKFDHNFDTNFPLDGGHSKVACISCHTPGEEKNVLGLERSCVDCHQPIDPHLGKLSKNCQSCHQTDSWNESIRYNHDFSDFPLTGSHQILVCESCHISVDFSNQSQKCISCHNADDIHQETLGEQCETCHDTSVWSHWRFDHQQQTSFELTGAHQNLKCNLCHNKESPDPIKPDTNCYACHRQDDVHDGGFGVDCQQCHTNEQFDELDF